MDVIKERDSGLRIGHHIVGDTRSINLKVETHNVYNVIESDYTSVDANCKDSGRKINFKSGNTIKACPFLNVNAIPFRENIHSIDKFNVYAQVFCLSARNNTGPGHYVDNAGRIHKIENEDCYQKIDMINTLDNNMEENYNCSSICTSASVIIGIKPTLNMVHNTDITGKGKHPPSWVASSHTLQYQGQFVVVENRQMSDGNHDNYLSISEASNSSSVKSDIYDLHRSNTNTISHISNNTLLSYKEISSCREIHQKIMQYDSVGEYTCFIECSSTFDKSYDDMLRSDIGDTIPKGSAPVPVPNTHQHVVHKPFLSIGSFSVRLVNECTYSKSPSMATTTDKERIRNATLNNSYFSTDIIEATRAFSKTTHYTREFGFLPLDRYVIHLECGTKTLSSEDMKSWVQEAHAVVKNTGCPNYRRARVSVPSGLCIDKWRLYLQDYDLKIVCEYLQFGFPVNLDYNLFTYVEEAVNHPSALDKKEGVDKYFQEELGYGAIVGPFYSKPFEKLHISPLMARSKPDGGTRVIVDLSWPRHCSVNSCVPTNFFDFIEFQLKYPTIDNLVGKIIQMGPTALMFKVDLQRAFRNLRMDPADYSVLGLRWRNDTYVEVATATRGGKLPIMYGCSYLSYAYPERLGNGLFGRYHWDCTSRHGRWGFFHLKETIAKSGFTYKS